VDRVREAQRTRAAIHRRDAQTPRTYAASRKTVIGRDLDVHPDLEAHDVRAVLEHDERVRREPGDRAVHLRARTSTVVPGEKRHVPSERVERALRLTLQAVDHRALVGLHSPQELALDSGDLIVL